VCCRGGHEVNELLATAHVVAPAPRARRVEVAGPLGVQGQLR